MSSQLALGYRPQFLGGEAWQRQLEALRAAVQHLGRKEVAFELDISGSALSDALNERESKRWAAEWTHVVKAMLVQRRDGASGELLRNLVESDVATTRFAVQEPIDLSADDVAHGYRNADRTTQEAIARILDKGKGRSR